MKSYTVNIMKKNKNEALEDSNKYYSIFENSESGIVLGKPDGTILEVNNAMIEMFGYSLVEIKKIGRLGLFDMTDPNMSSALEIRKREGKSKGILIGIRKNGERFPCEFTSAIYKLENGEIRSSTVLNDVTSRLKIEEEISLLLNNTEESFALIDLHLNIVSFNKQFKDGYKLHLKKIAKKGDSIFDYSKPERKKQMKNIYEKVLNGETIEIEIDVSDQNKIYLSKRYKPARNNRNEIIGICITSIDVTKKRIAEQQIIKSEKRFHSIFKHTSDFILLVNEDGYITFISPSLEKIIDSNATLINIQDMHYESLIFSEDINEAKQIFKELLQNPNTSLTKTIRIKSKNGNYIWVKGVATNLLNNEDINSIVINCRDITKEKLVLEKVKINEQLLKNNHDQLMLLTDAIDTVVYQFEMTPDGKMYFPFVSNSVKKLVPHIDIELLKEDASSAFAVVHPDDITGLINSIYESRNNLTSWNYEYRHIIIDDKEMWVKGASNPIKKEDGTVVWYGYLLDITDRKISEQKLKESEQRFKAIFDAEPECVKLINPNGNLVEINAAGLKMHEANSLEEIKSYQISDFIVPEYRQAFDQLHNETINGKKGSLDFEIIGLLGTRRWLEAHSAPIFDENNNVILMLSVTRDITERKLAEEKFKESELRLRTIFEADPDCLKLIDVNGNLIQMNQAGITLLEAKNFEEIKLHSLLDFILPQYQNSYNNILLNTINGKHEWLEFEAVGLKGTRRWLETSMVPLKNGLKKTEMILAVTRDITTRKLVEKSLQESEERYKTMVECSPDPIAVHANGKILYVNPTAIKLFGAKSLDEMIGKSILDIVHPDYHALVIQRIQNTLNGINNNIHDDYKLIMTDGTTKDIESEGTAIIYNGMPAVHIVMKDISKQKEEKLRLKLLESVIINTTESVMITEAEPFSEPGPRIIYVNDAFTKMTGYSLEEVIGKSPRFLQGENTDKKELEKLSASMKQWKSCEISVINYKKNGEEFWNNFSINPIANEKGWYTHWISIERDITIKKNNEIEKEIIITELSQNYKDLKQFSYVTSHNLRAPIANLLGLTSLIDHYKIPNKSLKKITDGIKQSALMFDETVKDLTQVLLIKDQINIAKEQVSLVNVIDKVMSQLSITVDDNEVKVNYDFNNARFVNFTTAYLESILLNLFTNSIKYKSPIRKLKINVSSSTTDNFILLKFNDNGIGIDTEKYKEKLFKLYQRFHDNPDGKGLGLYLVKSQLEALGATIDIDSRVNVGTTFVIKFKK